MEDGARYDAIKHVDSSSLAVQDFKNLETCGRPFIILNVMGPDFRTWWCNEVLGKLGNESAYFVEGDGTTGQRTLMESTFKVFSDESKQLSSRKYFAYMPTEVLPEKCPSLVDSLKQNLPSVIPQSQDDLFYNWPRGLRPAELLLTIAGKGARTQLACEGFHAVQWHLCMAGHQRFKLLPDERNRLHPLQFTEHPIGVNDEQGTSIFEVCSRLVSEIDLFATEFSGYDPLTHLDSFGPDLQRWPDSCDLPRALEVLLNPGDMLIIPGSWWLQCYFDEPTWTVSSHYLDLNYLDTVLQNMLHHNKLDLAKALPMGDSTAVEKIESALIAVLDSAGQGDGRQILERMRRLDKTLSGKEDSNAHLTETETCRQRERVKAQFCDVCGRPATTKCGRCKALWLCGAECQRRSWPDHKKTCIRCR